MPYRKTVSLTSGRREEREKQLNNHRPKQADEILRHRLTRVGLRMTSSINNIGLLSEIANTLVVSYQKEQQELHAGNLATNNCIKVVILSVDPQRWLTKNLIHLKNCEHTARLGVMICS